MSDTANPSGLCQCGCGQRTTLAPQTDPVKGWILGQPKRFLPLHWQRSGLCTANLRNNQRPRRPLAEHFWSKVNKDGPNGCWLWTGYKMHQGYGTISARSNARRTIRAHRLAWEITYGSIPDGLCVCHRCDVRLCVNPDHLFLGTRADNNTDKMNKGRNPAPPKLTTAHVLEIRREKATGTPTKALAARFGVSLTHVKNIVAMKRWPHVVGF